MYELRYKNSLFRQFSKTAQSDCKFHHGCVFPDPSVRMEQFGSHWTDFHEIRYLGIFRKKSFEKFKVWLQYDKA